MTQKASRTLIGLQLLALLVGTQIPGAWRSGAVQVMHAPSWLSSTAHFVLFAGMAMVLAAVRWAGLWRALCGSRCCWRC